MKKVLPSAGSRRKGVLWLGVAGALYGVVLTGTLRPGSNPYARNNLVPFASHLANLRRWLHGQASPWALKDLTINLLLLMPFAIALAAGLRLLLGPRHFVLPSLVLSAVASLFIEVAQLTIPSRSTDVTDLILNTTGAALGVGAVALWDRLRDEPDGPL